MRGFAVSMCVWLATVTARAQDMSFTIDESGPDPGARAADRPSQALATALAKYDLEQNSEAAVLLQRVVEGSSDDAASRVQQAQFFLAKALLRLGYLQSATAVFDEITAQPTHAYFAQSLPWLVELAQRAADPTQAIDLIGRYPEGELEQAASSLAAKRAGQLWQLAGRAALSRGDFAVAAQRLARVPNGTTAYLQAQFLAATTHVRLRHARPAIAAFQAIVRALDEGGVELGSSDERERMRNLAWLSLGRVYYTAAFTAPANEQGRLLGSAVDAWSRVDARSDDWLDALFESTWALFVTDEHARALGNLHALLSPYFPGAFYPEAHVLRAVIFFNSCEMDNADASLARFHRLYDPLRDELATLTDHEIDASRAALLLAQLDRDDASLSPRLRAVLTRALSDRELTRARAALAALAGERRALERAEPALRSSSLASRIEQDVLVARSLQQEQIGALVHARVERLLAELQDVENEADTVEIEVLNWRRGMIGVAPSTPAPSGRRVIVDAEHLVWPFDGEYWRDELGYYRQELSDRCGRR